MKSLSRPWGNDLLVAVFMICALFFQRVLHSSCPCLFLHLGFRNFLFLTIFFYLNIIFLSSSHCFLRMLFNFIVLMHSFADGVSRVKLPAKKQIISADKAREGAKEMEDEIRRLQEALGIL